MADKDLSYTNKDGLNPAAGFTNVFNYHKDGASEGEGYTTGGYPEIIGETSSLPSKNYKTGDDPDFFDNGNVWEQTQPEPGPDPTPPGPSYITLMKIGDYSQVAKEGYDNPYGEYIPEKDSEYYHHYYIDDWEAIEFNQNVEDTNIQEYTSTGEANTIWSSAEENYWMSNTSEGDDLSGIISSEADLLNLSIRLTCNGTEYVLPIAYDDGTKSYYVGQKSILDDEYPPTEGAIVAWTYPFQIDISRETWGGLDPLHFIITVYVRGSEDVVLEDIEIVREEE